MKKCIGLLALMSVFLFVACNAVESPFEPVNNDSAYLSAPSRAYSGDFLSTSERAVFDEINFARTEPGRYVREVLQPLLDRNDCYTDPNAEVVTKYVNTAIARMKKLEEDVNAGTVEPLKPVVLSLGLTLAARDFIADPGRNIHASTSADSMGPAVRAKHYVYFDNSGGGNIGEIAWPRTVNGSGVCDESLVAGWIVDNKNPNFGHRNAILGPNYHYVGPAFGYGAVNAEQDDYRGTPAAYAKFATATYPEKKGASYASEFKDELPLHNASIAKEVTWPVLRYIDGKFVQFGAAGQRGKTVKNPKG